ncbi:4-phosphopantoate--beta-alanine ligase, partial [Pseudomonas syringae pv. actinidiae]|nr:4-phosphopantoate--beta-alanine ligase [Pseudomonas syringae pv. actinidiae]
PDLAIFGEKDFQQLAVIRAMVRDLNMPSPDHRRVTVRADDGLALSSRNGYLDEAQRAAAPALYQAIRQTAEAISAGEQDFDTLLSSKKQQLQAAGFRIDYLEIRNADSLRPTTAEDPNLVILAAAFMGKTRLIDNLHLTSG